MKNYSFLQLSRILCSLIVFGAAASGPSSTAAARMPSFSQVASVVRKHFAQQQDRRPGDLISRSDVRAILAELEQRNWRVSDKAKILDEALESGHFLIRLFRDRDGKQFIRRVSTYRLVFDRLDRISQESGGERLIRDLVKLPDGERYARFSPARGVPGMVDFLPKGRSGKSRRVPDYKKPTGHLYTAKQLLERLAKSYADDIRRSVR